MIGLSKEVISSEKFAFCSIYRFVHPVPVIYRVIILPTQLHHASIADPIHYPFVYRSHYRFEVYVCLLPFTSYLLVYILQ